MPDMDIWDELILLTKHRLVVEMDLEKDMTIDQLFAESVMNLGDAS